MNYKIKLLFLFILGITCILSLSQSGRASYTSQVTIDCDIDNAYESEMVTSEYEFWYANSNNKHFILMNYTYDITGMAITLSTAGFFEDISAQEVTLTYLHSLHLNNILEFEIDRAVLNDQICISIDGDDAVLQLLPKSSGGVATSIVAPIEEEEDEDDEDDRPKFGLGDFFIAAGNAFNDNPANWFWFSMLMCIIVVRLWRVGEKPYTYVQKEKEYRKEYIGRIISEERSKQLPGFWKQKYKNNKGVKIYYSKMNHKEMKTYMFSSIAYIHQYYPHIIHMKVKLLPSLQFNDQVRADGKWNTFKYILYRLVCVIIPSGRVADSFYEKVSYTDRYEIIGKKEEEAESKKERRKIKKNKTYKTDGKGHKIPVKTIEVDILQHEYLMKRVKSVVDVDYQRYVIDDETKKVLEPISEKAVPLYQLGDLKKDPSIAENTIEELKHYKIIEEITDLKEAIEEKHAMDEVISIYEMEKSVANKKIQEQGRRYHLARNIIRKLKNEEYDNIEKAITEFQNELLFDERDIPSLAAKIAGIRNVTGREFEAVQIGISKYIDEKLKVNNNVGNLLLEDKINSLATERADKKVGQILSGYKDNNRIKITEVEDDLNEFR